MMTTFKHVAFKLPAGETVSIPDGDALIGAHVEPDGKAGGWAMVVHVLQRNEGAALPVPQKELAQ